MAQRQRSAGRRSRRYGGGRRGWTLVKYGMIVFGIGVVITVATYAFAVSRGGGTYLVSYGPMAVGLISMACGGIDMARERRAGGSAVGGAQADGQPGFGGAQADGQPDFGGPDFGGPDFGGQGGWQGAFQPTGAAQSAGAPMSAQTMWGAGAQGGWGSAADGGDRAGWGGSDYAGYGAASTANAANAMRSAPNAATPPANWYADPQNPAMLRWWDGQGWTSHVRPYN
jgi:hypothetical protein